MQLAAGRGPLASYGPLIMWVVLMLALLLSGCGGARTASGTDVAVSGSGPADSLVPGSTAVFTMTVQNVGNNAASDVKITDQLGGSMQLTGVTCQASGGATCPGVPALTMSVPSLPPGGTLVFQVSATVNALTSGTLNNQMAATTADDIGRLNNSATASATVVVAVNSLGVAQDAPTGAAAGSVTTFKVTVANPAGGTATNSVVINWGVTAPFALTGITYTCTAVNGAVCPDAQTGAPNMSFNVPSLALSHQLIFVFSVPIPDNGRGNIVSTATVSGVGDGDPSNNSSTVTTLASDARNGSYQVYAADGRQYSLTIDFDALQYTLDGNGSTVTRQFKADANSADGYTVSGFERLRTAQDLIVGSHAFAAGVLPYVAARKFAPALASLTGAFNLMSLSVNPDGTGAVTRAATARVSGNVLQLCESDFDAVSAASCGVGDLTSYLLSYSNNVYTAVDSAGTDSFNFVLAHSGAADIILSAGPSPIGSTLQFLIGTAESAALVPSTVFGPAVYPTGDRDWPEIDLTGTTYLVTGSVIDGMSGLFRLETTSPTAMLQGAPSYFIAPGDSAPVPAIDGAPIWVMQGYPLVVVFGATTSAPNQANASGMLQIGLP